MIYPQKSSIRVGKINMDPGYTEQGKHDPPNLNPKSGRAELNI